MSARVLIPVDNQECTLAALQSVKMRKWQSEPNFLLVNVLEDFRGLLGENVATVHREAIEAEEQSYAYQMTLWLNELKNDFSKAFPGTEAILEYGNTAERICEIAFEWGANLILLGSHDMNLSTKCALGSMATKIARLSPYTVEIIRSRELRKVILENGVVTDEDIQRCTVAPHKILIASDLSSDSEAAVDWFASIQWPSFAQVRIITVAAPQHLTAEAHWFGGAAGLYVKETRHQTAVQEELVNHAQSLKGENSFMTIEAELIIGDNPAEEIIRVAEEWGAQLVVTGAGGKQPDSCGKCLCMAGPTTLAALDAIHCGMVIVHGERSSWAGYSWQPDRASVPR